ncbi:hypothetical protein BKA67DRAFT_672170 [Truncatella angustata]|uniref:C2H2-type domain-containing protein n=1 Tax=Truncatella angustata TaxID=152316 RepID=A0A9P8UQJ0_9PEZI|nr:uncharacterized protein BKA67DRAFT_672170 [Truncatella angustata]KAH6656356.1 hypothetical protein BKA67DRAFT_672170 [Truncatella angustata]
MPHCAICREEHEDAAELRLHIWNSADHPYNAYCEICTTWFAEEKDLFSHFYYQHFRCSTCDWNFVDGNALQQHLRDKPEHKNKNNYCLLCNLYFEDIVHHSIDTFHNHKSVSTAHPWCDVCSLETKSLESLHDHFMAMPSDHHFCVLCKTIFSQEDEYEFHANKHHTWCSIDRKVFATEQAYKTHVKANQDTHFYCIKCDEAFTSAEQLEYHVWRNRATHETPPVDHDASQDFQ